MEMMRWRRRWWKVVRWRVRWRFVWWRLVENCVDENGSLGRKKRIKEKEKWKRNYNEKIFWRRYFWWRRYFLGIRM